MALFCRRYVLASTPVIHPLQVPPLPLPPIGPGVHVTLEVFRREHVEGDPPIEPEFIPAARMTYQDGNGVAQVFSPVDLTDLPDGLGSIATVGIRKTIDAGGEFFSLLIPTVKPVSGGVAAITTTGLVSRTAGPDRPTIQTPVYTSVALSGTYSDTEGGPVAEGG